MNDESNQHEGGYQKAQKVQEKQNTTTQTGQAAMELEDLLGILSGGPGYWCWDPWRSHGEHRRKPRGSAVEDLKAGSVDGDAGTLEVSGDPCLEDNSGEAGALEDSNAESLGPGRIHGESCLEIDHEEHCLKVGQEALRTIWDSRLEKSAAERRGLSGNPVWRFVMESRGPSLKPVWRRAAEKLARKHKIH
ncbi:hypothetical protein CRENBAI_005608 [Crenichthys baileyi]|uniref:Uncharacterized protein n=1 Tax=Crenichthys baileyi TaxID=28760 RepID=A0AAV9S1C1_9TELE